jgi:DNA-binding protein YbaB
MFDKMKDLYNMQKKAKEVQNKLQKIHIEAEVDGVKVTLNGKMDVVKDIYISEQALALGSVRLGTAIKEAFVKAKKKAEQVSAEHMKDIMGDMGMPGLQ